MSQQLKKAKEKLNNHQADAALIQDALVEDETADEEIPLEDTVN